MNDFFEAVSSLRSSGRPFAIATVIAVRGSASAKPGSKALIDHTGRNVWGWVGGGCAESFVARNAVEAMDEGRTRIVQADLDDQIFGLGMPCGGVMDVFIDPQQPPERISISAPPESQPSIGHLASTMGYAPEFSRPLAPGPGLASIAPLPNVPIAEQILLSLARGLATSRGASFRSLRETKGVFGERSIANQNWIQRESEFLIMGSSRITEELAKFGALAKWPVRVYGWNLDPANYPSGATLQTAATGYTDLRVTPGSFVMVASHHKGDHEFIQAALESGANYVGLIASEKRSRLVFKHLSEQGLSADRLRRIHAPAGLDLACKQPQEIALSVVSEIILAKAAAEESA